MCGIFAVFNYQGDVSAYRQRALYLSKKYVSKPQYHILTSTFADQCVCLTPLLCLGSDIVVLTGQAALPLVTILWLMSVLLLLVLVSLERQTMGSDRWAYGREVLV